MAEEYVKILRLIPLCCYYHSITVRFLISNYGLLLRCRSYTFPVSNIRCGQKAFHLNYIDRSKEWFGFGVCWTCIEGLLTYSWEVNLGTDRRPYMNRVLWHGESSVLSLYRPRAHLTGICSYKFEIATPKGSRQKREALSLFLRAYRVSHFVYLFVPSSLAHQYLCGLSCNLVICSNYQTNY